jgi:hypothetical protein
MEGRGVNGRSHQVAGYDRLTEALAFEYELAPAIFKKVKKLIVADPNDAKLVASYPLSNGQLREITDLTGEPFDNDRYEFFLEPSGRAA